MEREPGMKDLNLRLERVEAKLDALGGEPAVSALTEADVAAFHKVQNAFWEDGGCGINETSPCVFRCNIFKGGKVVPIKVKVCDVECICGPCNIGGGGLGGGIRFRGLGG
jgi:hypothetical protein